MKVEGGHVYKCPLRAKENAQAVLKAVKKNLRSLARRKFHK